VLQKGSVKGLGGWKCIGMYKVKPAELTIVAALAGTVEAVEGHWRIRKLV